MQCVDSAYKYTYKGRRAKQSISTKDTEGSHAKRTQNASE